MLDAIFLPFKNWTNCLVFRSHSKSRPYNNQPTILNPDMSPLYCGSKSTLKKLIRRYWYHSWHTYPFLWNWIKDFLRPIQALNASKWRPPRRGPPVCTIDFQGSKKVESQNSGSSPARAIDYKYPDKG